MTEELLLIENIVRKLYLLWQAHRWEHEARKALRDFQSCRADVALAKAREIYEMM